MILAAASPDSSEIGTWILIAILVINGLGAVGGLIAIFATRREVEAIERRVSASEVQREQDMQIGSDRRAKIYAELRSQREDFQLEIKQVYDRIERTEKTFHEALRHLPNEIIATLRNTGVIK